MANEAAVLAQLTFARTAAPIIAGKSEGAATPIQATVVGTTYIQSTMSVPTTAGGTAIPLGGVSPAGGLFCIKNLDPTNYVTILTAASGTAFLQILSGDPPAVGRFAPTVTAPAALANTAPAEIEYLFLPA